MVSTLLPLVVLATPAVSAILSNGTYPASALDDQLSCTTSFASIAPYSVLTSSKTETSTRIDTSIVTYTPSISLTLQASTLTVGEFATTTETTIVPQVTDTFYSTSTCLATTSITSAIVETETAAATTTISASPETVHIAAPYGFTPIGSAVPGVAKRSECGPAQPSQAPLTVTITVTSTLVYSNDVYYTVTKSGEWNHQRPNTLQSLTKTTTDSQSASEAEQQSTGVPALAPSESWSRYHYYNTTSRYIAASGYAPSVSKPVDTATSSDIKPFEDPSASMYAPTGVIPSSMVSFTHVISADPSPPTGVIPSNRVSFTPVSSANSTTSSTSPSIFAHSTSYPAAVECTSILNIGSITTITETAAMVTNLATPYVTETSTSTITTTTSVMEEDCSTTLVATEYSTISSIVLATSTTTLTATQTVSEVSGATPTSYAACAANNLISSVNGAPVTQVQFLTSVLSALKTNSAYDCCVACQTAAGGCAGSVYLNSGACYLAAPGATCGVNSIITNKFYTSSSAGTAGAFTVSNGLCGQMSYSAY
ncbi:uncharacterized protein EAE98_004745 [Botrytis deweyae]|uniref:Apple domain-containing protein n=1 Tax=Botrytis deweyae TaxID=2478750 RepID=A0ABQ7IP73_9HELO|nr:uncharacterized protein EAE98_004745 [Botrytis deweyae]KAF7930344.1 hypothetical protein EAE98_004745 [Botrytis deweyae]